MSELWRIDDQIQRMFEGNPWHGPSLGALLEGVDAKTAAARPIPGARADRPAQESRGSDVTEELKLARRGLEELEPLACRGSWEVLEFP